jgi:hypothetical protein
MANPPTQFLSQLAPVDHPQMVAGAGMALPRFSAPSDANAQPSILSRTANPVLDQHRYAYVGGSLTLQPVANVSNQIIQAQNALRNALFFRNASTTANFYVEFGTDATTNAALQLQPGQTIFFDTVVPQDDVFVLADAASGILRYWYSTIGVR